MSYTKLYKYGTSNAAQATMKNPFLPLLASILAVSASVQAVTITFDPPASTWDTAYDSASLDVEIVSHASRWPGDYNDLENVAYTVANGSLIIDFIPLGGHSVTLQSFDLGNYINAGGTTQYHVYDYSDLDNPILSVTDITVPYSTTSHPTYNVNLTSFNGLRLMLGPDLYNIGIDNIVVSTAVSTPDGGATALILALGLLPLALCRRGLSSC